MNSPYITVRVGNDSSREEVEKYQNSIKNHLDKFRNMPAAGWCPLAKMPCNKECICYVNPKTTSSVGPSDQYTYIHDSYCNCYSLVGGDG